MRVAPILFAATLLLNACHRSGAPPMPSVLVDDVHNHLHADATQAYTVAAGAGFTLDASQFSFAIPQPLAGVSEPNAIQLVVEGSIYSVPWRSGVARYDLSLGQLVPLKGAAQASLRPGTQVILAIGYQKAPEPDGTVPFWPFWASLVRIVPPGA